MRTNTFKDAGIIYGLDDKPELSKTLLAAFQHVMASFVGIITPTLIIAGTLDIGEHIPYMISMALIVSGVATFIQCKGVGPVGSRLLSLQGTSFSFIGAIIAAGFALKARGYSGEDMLGTLFGVLLVGSGIEMILSRFIEQLRRVITPVVTGVVIITIGITLCKVGLTDMAGGFAAKGDGTFGDIKYLTVGFLVLFTIIGFSRARNPLIRLSAILIGGVTGYIAAIFLGLVDFASAGQAELITVPIPFKFGFGFDMSTFLAIALLYVITAIETTGDLTATSMLSGRPVEGPEYVQRIKRGVLGDGVNSAIAAIFNTFPNTTFSQNNGIIQLTGVASRYVGLFVAGMFVILGLFPVIGSFLQTVPKPVLGGATLVMFGTIALAGIKILMSQNLNRRNTMIASVSLGLGMGLAFVPEAFQALPTSVTNVIGTPISLAGLTAITLSLVLPRTQAKELTEAQSKAYKEGVAEAEGMQVVDDDE